MMKNLNHIERTETEHSVCDVYYAEPRKFIVSLVEAKHSSYRGHHFRVGYFTKSGILKERYFDCRADSEAFIERNWSNIIAGATRFDA